MNEETKRLRDDPSAREELRERLDRYLDVPLALASLALVLLAVIELTGEVSGPWEGRLATLGWVLWGLFFVEFAAKYALAPVKRSYLREHWLDVLIVLLPFLRFLRVLQVLQASRALPTSGSWSSGAGARSLLWSYSSAAGSASSQSSR